MSQWFFLKGTMQIGPVTAQQIREYARGGQIAPETPLRKASDDKWIKASQIKGLFEKQSAAKLVEPEDSDADPPDPLIALTTQAATAIGGAISGLFNNARSQGPPKAAPLQQPPSTSQGLLHALTRDDQSPDIVAKVIEKVQQILIAGEELRYVAVQNKPIVNLVPDCIALTNRRFILYQAKLLGRADFVDYVWRELYDATLSDDIIGSTFSIVTAGGNVLKLDYLPRSQARAVYRFAQEMEERALSERRARQLEEMRAEAGGVTVQNNIAGPNSASTPAPTANGNLEKLRELKSMLDAGLITASEFETKKAEVLARI